MRLIGAGSLATAPILFNRGEILGPVPSICMPTVYQARSEIGYVSSVSDAEPICPHLCLTA
jgi:hypothetical protein